MPFGPLSIAAPPRKISFFGLLDCSGDERIVASRFQSCVYDQPDPVELSFLFFAFSRFVRREPQSPPWSFKRLGPSPFRGSRAMFMEPSFVLSSSVQKFISGLSTLTLEFFPIRGVSAPPFFRVLRPLSVVKLMVPLARFCSSQVKTAAPCCRRSLSV